MDDAAARRLPRGVAGAVLIVVAFGLLNALATPVFLPGDESAHVGYALDVWHGRLPVYHDPVRRSIAGMRGTPTWTAMHPPLYYALVGGPLRLAIALRRPLAGVLAVRLLDVAAAAGLVVVVAALALRISPRRGAAVTAAALLAATPSLQQVAGFVYNDAPALLAATAVVLAATAVAQRGGRRGDVLTLGVLIAVAVAVRASGAAAALVAAATVGADAVRRRAGPVPRRLLVAGGRAVAVVVPALAVIGWFYVRNWRLYGDPAGMGVAARGAPRTWRAVASPSLWLREYRHMWGHVTLLTELPSGVAAVVYALLAIVVAAAAVAGVRLLRRRSARPLVVASPAIAYAVLTAVAFADYVHRGAIPFERYLMPALPVVVVVAGLALTSLPRVGAGVAAGAVVTATSVCVVMTVVVLRAAERTQRYARAPHLLSLSPTGLTRPALPALALLAVGVAGAALVVADLLASALRRDTPVDASPAAVATGSSPR